MTRVPVALILTAMLSMSVAAPTSSEVKAEAEATDVTHKDVDVGSPQEPETTTDPERLIIITTEPSSDDDGFGSFFDCLRYGNQVDPYFDPYYRLRMQDPVFRRLEKARKCPFGVKLFIK